MSTYFWIVYDVSNLVTVHFTDQWDGFSLHTMAHRGSKGSTRHVEREGDRNFITLNYLMKSNALPSTFFFPSALDGHVLIWIQGLLDNVQMRTDSPELHWHVNQSWKQEYHSVNITCNQLGKKLKQIICLTCRKPKTSSQKKINVLLYITELKPPKEIKKSSSYQEFKAFNNRK